MIADIENANKVKPNGCFVLKSNIEFYALRNDVWNIVFLSVDSRWKLQFKLNWYPNNSISPSNRFYLSPNRSPLITRTPNGLSFITSSNKTKTFMFKWHNKNTNAEQPKTRQHSLITVAASLHRRKDRKIKHQSENFIVISIVLTTTKWLISAPELS